MHTRTLPLAALAAASLVLAGCSSDSTTESSESASSDDTTMAAGAVECLPVPGEQLVVLDDDMMLQNSDNIIPALNADSATDPILEALDAVSAALDTPTLIELNKAVDIDRQTSEEVAENWVEESGLSIAETGDGSSLTIGAANFSENITLAEIYSEVLDDAGYDTEVREIGTRETYLPALLNGEIDIVPEYAATFTEYLNLSANGSDAEPVASGDISATVAALEPLAADQGIVIGSPADAQDQNAFAVTSAFAQEYEVSTLTDLAETCGGIALGGPPECPERTFCQIGLEETYGVEVDQFLSLDAGGPLTKNAILNGDVAVGLVFSSDGQLAVTG
ncbi:glycine betaine ABC transporter substrate-binding protein [Demequina sediminicola]|uniref:glycine betaine ABC transporter substrate-binding protein n=1 Tax=Demequina sediminicola TaxID=1095026 RepID=UPI0007864F8D|nr:glycine betaine ABC transporter substrate-binding protein [Demequina sediminicola]